MAKWFGKIGYVVTEETEPGVWEETVTEREYFGDMTSDRRKRQNSGEVNDDINLSNVISIVADPFAYQNCSMWKSWVLSGKSQTLRFSVLD